ncbi:hypothetical protein GCM10022285_66660 [Streptomyces tunisiensis]|uniref:Uncharacterized protein n=1 Tax=Streptomyces tunisiensis TaxID=948699 RepID=A0ABP7ZCE4_9ACTN
MHVAPLVVVPQIPLGLVDVVLPQAYSCADIAWLQIAAGVLEAADLGQCTRRQAVDDRPCTVVRWLPGAPARICPGRLRGMDLSVRRHAAHGATVSHGVSNGFPRMGIRRT